MVKFGSAVDSVDFHIGGKAIQNDRLKSDRMVVINLGKKWYQCACRSGLLEC